MMSYRIPNDDEVARAIENSLIRVPRVRSQTAFFTLVLTELLCVDLTFRVSNERIRRIGVERGLFDLEISYAHKEGVQHYTRCPVCRSELRSVMNKTLDGDPIELSRDCTKCGYSAKGSAIRPCRYIIARRK